MLKTIANGEKFSTSTTIAGDGNEAIATFTVRTSTGEVRNVVENAVFDFEDCTRMDLLKLAMKTIIITEQSRFRLMDDKIKRDRPETWERSHNVLAEFVNVARAKKSMFEKAGTLVAGLSPDELTAMKAQIDALEAGK